MAGPEPSQLATSFGGMCCTGNFLADPAVPYQCLDISIRGRIPYALGHNANQPQAKRLPGKRIRIWTSGNRQQNGLLARLWICPGRNAGHFWRWPARGSLPFGGGLRSCWTRTTGWAVFFPSRFTEAHRRLPLRRRGRPWRWIGAYSIATESKACSAQAAWAWFTGHTTRSLIV